MTLTPSADTADASPADDEQALIWALINHQVRKISPGVFEVQGQAVKRNGRVAEVKFRVRVEL